MRVEEPGGELTAHRGPTVPPVAGHVRVSVTASGMCGADVGTAQARGACAPVVPGHEIAGVIAEIGEGVRGLQVGERVAVGWFGGSCGHCEACRRGDVVHCPERQVPGMSYPGGWAESITVPAGAIARIPAGLDAFDAAPMGCAGVTTFNAIRRAEVPAGGRIAVFGLGGLGHLAVQFAAALGHEVVAIARGPERAEPARSLGASAYIDAAPGDPGRRLRELGGVDAVLVTAPAAEPLPELLDGLSPHGRLVLLGIGGDRFALPVGTLVMNALRVQGHVTGGPIDIEETMRFAVRHDVRPMIERIPLADAQHGLERLRAGRARFRVVLDASAS